jgi:hypothetical protein
MVKSKHLYNLNSFQNSSPIDFFFKRNIHKSLSPKNLEFFLFKCRMCDTWSEMMYKEKLRCGREKRVTSMKTVFNTLPETVVILAVIILTLKDSKTSQSFTIVSVLLLHVKLTNNVFSPM